MKNKDYSKILLNELFDTTRIAIYLFLVIIFAILLGNRLLKALFPIDLLGMSFLTKLLITTGLSIAIYAPFYLLHTFHDFNNRIKREK